MILMLMTMMIFFKAPVYPDDEDNDSIGGEDVDDDDAKAPVHSLHLSHHLCLPRLTLLLVCPVNNSLSANNLELFCP